MKIKNKTQSYSEIKNVFLPLNVSTFCVNDDLWENIPYLYLTSLVKCFILLLIKRW